jgi:hypothetical protein
MLNRTVTGDEPWLNHYESESKHGSMQWKYPSSSSTKKFKVTPSAGKFRLTVVWHTQGVLLTYFQERGENVNSSGCNWQKTYRPTGKRGAVSS